MLRGFRRKKTKTYQLAQLADCAHAHCLCIADTRRQQGIVPDEQRLYENLMTGYESSVRPVINASRTIVVSFKLTLNQIIDLDERKQVLTTNVFIDQVRIRLA